MTQHLWTQLDDLVSAKTMSADPILESVLLSNRVAGLPAIDVSPAQGKFLHLVARMTAAARILEIGTLGGYSTIWLARALPDKGRLISLEFDPHHATVARNNIANAGQAEKVKVLTGAALDTLPQLAEQGIGPFDLIFIDADKDNMPTYLDWAVRLSRPGTVIICDNVIREGAILDAGHPDPRVQGVLQTLAAIGANPRLSASVLQTVGAKGHDGFAIAIVD